MKRALGRRDEFGQRYTLYSTLEWQNKSAVVRSGWIIETDSEIPRLTSCYPLALSWISGIDKDV